MFDLSLQLYSLLQAAGYQPEGAVRHAAGAQNALESYPLTPGKHSSS